MKRYLFNFTADKILSEAKNITMSIGASRLKQDGSTMFREISLTEDDDILFQRFLKDANAHLLEKLSAYLFKCEEENEDYDICDLDPNNRVADDDLRLYRLCYPCEFETEHSIQQIQVIDNYMIQFLIYYVIYRWLLIKYPEEAQTYLLLSNEFIDKVISAINRVKGGKIRRPINPF